MDCELLGWPEDGPTLELDHEAFAYAGKFVMSATGKAVGREDGAIVAAAAFDEDRTDPATLRIRYVTVRRDRRGEGRGPRLADFVVRRARERGYDRVAIAVNNPFAYRALYRAGFGFTGEETGLAELVLARPGDRSPAAYRRGLRRFAGRDLAPEERAFVEAHLDGTPPDPIGDGNVESDASQR